jgi:hypothetical protein
LAACVILFFISFFSSLCFSQLMRWTLSETVLEDEKAFRELFSQLLIRNSRSVQNGFNGNRSMKWRDVTVKGNWISNSAFRRWSIKTKLIPVYFSVAFVGKVINKNVKTQWLSNNYGRENNLDWNSFLKWKLELYFLFIFYFELGHLW